MQTPDSPSILEPRRQILVDSLRQRYQEALQHGDDATRQDLFREAAYLGILPEHFQDPIAPEGGPGSSQG
ncbi:hypothetical protein [Synechococcus sp. CS-1328]|uniref:hypothetical protein n=1 Tax=Synechococcus sp. CS-1328 TaxID=2847976 RepID=UPI00223A8526|nr:hypothetical protein [Synechococcus sp. CS-1328]MCT0226527.1 hypothetical protein [Synechococcus sp. CS-1328]